MYNVSYVSYNEKANSIAKKRIIRTAAPIQSCLSNRDCGSELIFGVLRLNERSSSSSVKEELI